MSNVKAFFTSSMLQMKQTFSRNMFRFMMLINPVIFGTIMYLMFRNSGRDDFAAHVIFGSGLITIWGTIIFSSASDIDRERWMGTLETLFCSPVKFSVIMSGKIFGNVILGLFSMIYSTVFIVLVFEVEFKVVNEGYFILTLIITLISFMGISMLFATILAISRQARVFMNALDYPIYILCGLVFPIDLLPRFIQYISYTLSPTWASELLKMTAVGIHDIQEFYLKLIILTGISVIYIFLALYLFKVIDKKARVKATLEVV